MAGATRSCSADARTGEQAEHGWALPRPHHLAAGWDKSASAKRPGTTGGTRRADTPGPGGTAGAGMESAAARFQRGPANRHRTAAPEETIRWRLLTIIPWCRPPVRLHCNTSPGGSRCRSALNLKPFPPDWRDQPRPGHHYLPVGYATNQARLLTGCTGRFQARGLALPQAGHAADFEIQRCCVGEALPRQPAV